MRGGKNCQIEELVDDCKCDGFLDLLSLFHYSFNSFLEIESS